MSSGSELELPDAMNAYSVEVIARIRAEIARALEAHTVGVLVTFYPELAGWAIEPEPSLVRGTVGFRLVGR